MVSQKEYRIRQARREAPKDFKEDPETGEFESGGVRFNKDGTVIGATQLTTEQDPIGIPSPKGEARIRKGEEVARRSFRRGRTGEKREVVKEGTLGLIRGQEFGGARREITPQEIESGLTQQDIDQGLGLESIGTATGVTAGDLTGGIGKGALTAALTTTAARIGVRKGLAKEIINKKTRETIRPAFVNFFKINFDRAEKIARKFKAEPIKESMKVLRSKPVKQANVLGLADAFLINWYGMDNMADGAKINSNALLSRVRDGTVSLEEGLERNEELLERANIARSKVLASTRINPWMYPFSKVVMSGINGSIRDIELNMQDLQTIGSPENVGLREDREEITRRRAEGEGRREATEEKLQGAIARSDEEQGIRTVP